MSTQPRESEVALVIRADQPEQIAKQIADLDAIGAYRLQRQKSERIHDIHFDISAHTLQAKRLALRIRQVDSKYLITLKGPSKQRASGGTDRTEIEEPWSSESLTKILGELRENKIEISNRRDDFDQAHPVATMQRLGFEVIQDRNTHRRVRQVLAKSDDTVLAELAIDTVTYHFGKQIVRLHEIEVEWKAKDRQVRLGDIIKNLKDQYAALQEWEGKLWTGIVIGELLQNGSLKTMLDQNNNLTPAAYDLIRKHLRV